MKKICRRITGIICLWMLPVYAWTAWILTNESFKICFKDLFQEWKETFWQEADHDGHSQPYLDDGELQCGACTPVWDFKRQPLIPLVKQALSVLHSQLREKEAELEKQDAILDPKDYIHEQERNGVVICVLRKDLWDIRSNKKRDEDEAELAELRRAVQYANDDKKVILAENEHLRQEVDLLKTELAKAKGV